MKPHLKSQQLNSTTLIEVKLNLSSFLVNSDGKKMMSNSNQNNQNQESWR